MKLKLSFLLMCIGLFTQAQIVNIPDANFKAYLVGNSNINTNGDSEIQVSEAVAFTGSIQCGNMHISDLTGIEAFVNLTQLGCVANQLTSLDLSSNVALTYLYVHNNQLTSLNVSGNTALVDLSCWDNQLTSLDLSNNTALTTLACGLNLLVGLDVSNNTTLTQLHCGDNLLTSLDISNSPVLLNLTCYGNQLTNLDVSNNTALMQLSCANNLLASLDVHNNLALTSLSCSDNLLVSLNLTNGNNTSFTSIFANNNPNLTCIQVDDAVYSTTNWIGGNFQFDPQTSFDETCCTVNIPDANFKAYLIGNPSINTNGDTEIQCSEAFAYTGQILCGNMNISDLTGIEAFVNVTDLQASNNNLTFLDVSSNTPLTTLYLFNNQLSTLDISNNPALTQLTLYDNQITSIDVSNNTNLTTLLINNNQLTSIDVSNNPALIALDLRDNLVNVIDLSNNTALVQLSLNNNQISSLYVSSNTALSYLSCINNQLTDLDLSHNPALVGLVTDNNPITSLDLGNNPGLTQLSCNDNNLSSLNLANDNNNLMVYIAAQNNPNLTCIQVDDADYSNSNWTGTNFQFDSWSTFSEDCCTVQIPDANFKAYLVGNSAINTNGDTEIQCSEATLYTGTISCGASNISNLSGIEAFTNITALYCYNNALTSLDISQNTLLTELRCNNNQLISLDLSNNVVLANLSLHTNQLSSLDLSNNTALTQLMLFNNQLTSLNVANGNNNLMVYIAAQNNPNLTCIQVDDTAYSTANWVGGNFQFDSWAAFSEDCTLGIDDLSDNKIAMYPNPANGFVNLSNLPANSHIKIFDFNGKMIYIQYASGQITISTTNFATGTYIVRIENNNKTIHKKLVIKN